MNYASYSESVSLHRILYGHTCVGPLRVTRLTENLILEQIVTRSEDSELLSPCNALRVKHYNINVYTRGCGVLSCMLRSEKLYIAIVTATQMDITTETSM